MMSAYHQNILTKNRLLLVRGIDMNEALLSSLEADNLLTKDMVQRIKAERTPTEQNGKLLDILPRRGQDAFDRLIQALVETDQQNLAKRLDSASTARWVLIRDARRAEEQALFSASRPDNQNLATSFSPELMKLVSQANQILYQATILNQANQQNATMAPHQRQQTVAAAPYPVQLSTTILGLPDPTRQSETAVPYQEQLAATGVPYQEQQDATIVPHQIQQTATPMSIQEQQPTTSMLFQKQPPSENHSSSSMQPCQPLDCRSLDLSEDDNDENNVSTSGEAPEISLHAENSLISGLLENSTAMRETVKGIGQQYDNPDGKPKRGLYQENFQSDMYFQSDDVIRTILKDFHVKKELRIDVARTEADVCKALLSQGDVYAVRNATRGRAVIINNDKFYGTKLDPRDGAEIDQLNLTHLFRNLNFDVVIHRNLTREGIINRLEEERWNPAHTRADMFLLFILTHGCQGAIMGTDGEQLEIETITKLFDGEHCEALKDKPKMFFFQACQGEKLSRSVSSKYATDSDKVENSEEANEDENMDGANVRMKTNETGEGMETVRTRINQEEEQAELLRMGVETLSIRDVEAALTPHSDTHEKADMLISYATVQDYKAWRRIDNGSWFVRCIVFVFSKFAWRDHVCDLLTMVNNVLSELRTQDDSTTKRYRQIAEKRDTLRKKVYFLPGYRP